MKVVVIGAGVIGLWCARDLLAEGAEVTVVDRGAASMASPAAAGWIVPALSAPLAGPGVVKHLAHQVVRRETAFGLQPSLSPTLLRWLGGFAASARGSRYRHGLQAILALASDSIEAFDRLRHDGLSFERHDGGLLMAARTEAGLHDVVGLVEDAAAAGYRGGHDVLDGDQARDREPALSDAVTGAVHARNEIWVRPEDLLTSLAKDVAEGGGTVLDGTGVSGVDTAPGGRWTVHTDREHLTADRVVIAAGVWSRALLAGLGVRVPLLAGTGYSVTSAGRGTGPRLALKLAEPNIAVTPFDGGVRVSGRFDLGRTGADVPQRRMRRVLARTEPYLASWRAGSVSAEYAGLRPATPDSLPLIGPVPGAPGVVAATGHGMLGLTLAPGTADDVRRLVLHGERSPRVEPFALERYARRA